MVRSIRVAVALWAGVVLSGCAAVQPKPPTVPALASVAGGGEQGWWEARFKMNWPKDSQPSWYVDLLLAHRVIAPVLEANRKEIALWRFHRRAAPDAGGHTFRFIFYSSRTAARQIIAALQADPMLAALKSRGVVIETGFDDINGPLKPAVEATSDKNWSQDVQKSWPYYIMGVCEMWLRLVDGAVKTAAEGKKLCSLDDSLELYKQVNEAITRTWQEEGDHAFLHHMNAIFGYEPLIVLERRPMTF